MSTIITTIILTILAYQLITLIVFIASGENDDLTLQVATGVWFLICGLVTVVAQKIMLGNARRKYKLYQFFGKVSESKMPTKSDKWLNNYYMTDEVAQQFRQCQIGETPTEDYCVRLLRSGKAIKSIPMKSEILTAEKIANGCPEMTADFIAKFKK